MKIERNPKFGANFQLYTSISAVDHLIGQISGVHNFQRNVTTSVMNQLKQKVEMYQNRSRELYQAQQAQKVELDAAKSELAAWHNDKQKLRDENRQLREQNKQLVQSVNVLKGKLTDERHASGGPVRNRPPGLPDAQRSGPYAMDLPDVSAPKQRLTLSALDRSEPQMRHSGATYTVVPAFPIKLTPNTTPLTLSAMRNSASASRMSVDYGNKTGASFRFT